MTWTWFGVAYWFFLLGNLACAFWLLGTRPRVWFVRLIGVANVAVFLALATLPLRRAYAGNLVPETTPDGYAALVAAFPAGAEQVCIIREDSPGEPECRVRPIGRGALQVALWLRKLEPGSTYCAYSVKGGVAGPLSEDCWVGPAVEVKP